MSEEVEIDYCEVEWERPKGLCNPHSCDLPRYHQGPHLCDCGLTRRVMERDEPDRFDERLRV